MESDYERQQPRTSTEKNEEIAGLNDSRFRSVRKAQPEAKAGRTTGSVKNSPCPTRAKKFKRELSKATSLKDRYEITYAWSVLEFEILQNKLKRRGTLPSDPKHRRAPRKPKAKVSETENGIFDALKFGEQPAQIVALIAKSNIKRVESIMHRMSMQNEVIRRRVIPDIGARGYWMYSLAKDSK